MGKIKACHTDKAFGVDHLMVVANKDLKRLNGCQRDKIPHLRKGVDRNVKFLHNFALLLLYKDEKSVYNKKNAKAFPVKLSLLYRKNLVVSIDSLDDYNKKDT